MTDHTTAAAEAIAARNVTLRAFILRLLDPEDFGHAVTPEVRQAARAALGMREPEQAA